MLDRDSPKGSTTGESRRYEPPRIMRKRAVAEVTMCNTSHGGKHHHGHDHDHDHDHGHHHHRRGWWW